MMQNNRRIEINIFTNLEKLERLIFTILRISFSAIALLCDSTNFILRILPFCAFLILRSPYSAITIGTIMDR